jgi:hypothetical protein
MFTQTLVMSQHSAADAPMGGGKNSRAVGMAEAAERPRRRRFSGGVTPGEVFSNSGSSTTQPGDLILTTTQRLAMAYDPGAVRIRLTAIRDILAVLRARYLDTIFRIALAVLGLHLGLSVWYAQQDVAASLSKVVRAPLADMGSAVLNEVC